MEIHCTHCQGRMKIPDDKVPSGKSFGVTCPRCKHQITVPGETTSSASDHKDRVAQMCDQIASEQYDASERPFGFIEEEGKTALICEVAPELKDAVNGPLKLLGYHLTLCDSARQALKNMRYHDYNLIVVNELFDAPNPDANGVLIYLERLGMEVRRNVFVTLISARFRSMDRMMALRNSVNLIVNQVDIDDFGKILLRGISDYEFFYRPFKEAKRGAELG